MFMPDCAYLRVADLYARDSRLGSFPQDLDLHLRYGFVISTPSTFFMGRPVVKGAPSEQLNNLTFQFKDPDAWFIWAAAGHIDGLTSTDYPFPLPWTGWGRRGDVRWYRSETLWRRGGQRVRVQQPGIPAQGKPSDYYLRGAICEAGYPVIADPFAKHGEGVNDSGPEGLVGG